jgi:hypothetical protein
MVLSGNSPMPMTGVEKCVMGIWIAGIVVWFPTALLLWWQGYHAQTFAQAALSNQRLGFVSGLGSLWMFAGIVWRARLKKRGQSKA